MAQPPTQHRSPIFTPSFNPFGPNSTIGDSPDPASRLLEEIHAPQGRVPVAAASLSMPPTLSRPDSRPNFALGFGLQVPQEAEEEEEEYLIVAPEADQEINGDDGYEQEGYDDPEEQEEDEQEEEEDHDTDLEEERDGMTTAGNSRLHSRHVSNALSLASVGGNSLAREFAEDLDQDAIGEWTGSEDLHFDSGDEVCHKNYVVFRKH